MLLLGINYKDIPVMLSYDLFPPCKLLMRVLKIAPRAAVLYIMLWKQNKKRLYIPKDSIRGQYLIGPIVFRNLSIELANLDLLIVKETGDDFSIEIKASHYES